MTSKLHKRILLRLPHTLYSLVEKQAALKLRSVNNELIVLLKMGLVNDAEEAKVLEMANQLVTESTAKTDRPDNTKA